MTKVTEINLGICNLSRRRKRGLNKRKQKKESTNGMATSLESFNAARIANTAIIPKKMCEYLLMPDGVSVMGQL